MKEWLFMWVMKVEIILEFFFCVKFGNWNGENGGGLGVFLLFGLIFFIIFKILGDIYIIYLCI